MKEPAKLGLAITAGPLLFSNYFRVDMYIRLVQFKQTNIGIRFRIQHYVRYISGDRCIAA